MILERISNVVDPTLSIYSSMSKRKSGVLAVVHARGPAYRDAAAGLLGAVKKSPPPSTLTKPDR